jgi:hypothetical protein
LADIDASTPAWTCKWMRAREDHEFRFQPVDRERLEDAVPERESPQDHAWRARIGLMTFDGAGTRPICAARRARVPASSAAPKATVAGEPGDHLGNHAARRGFVLHAASQPLHSAARPGAFAGMARGAGGAAARETRGRSPADKG